MHVKEQITKHIAGQPETKRGDMQELHRLALRVAPACPLSFFDGKDSSGKVVSNPTIGYGSCTMRYADGSTKDVFRVGLSANATGISLYLMGLEDKTYLPRTFGKTIGKSGVKSGVKSKSKVSVTGYCVRFKGLNDINMDVLEAVVRYGLGNRGAASSELASRKTSRVKAGRRKTAPRMAALRKPARRSKVGTTRKSAGASARRKK
jgi:hypothetical protein